MRTTLLLSLSVLSAALIGPAHASFIDAKFAGTVASQAGTSNSVGSAISGEFVYDTDTSAYRSFSVAGVPIPAGFASSATVVPDQSTAIYTAQISPVSLGGGINNTFTLSLSALTIFPTLNAIALLTNPTQLATNLDLASNSSSLFPSTFGYYRGTASGTDVQRVSANLTSINVAVPEPASLAVLGISLFGFAAVRRRT